MASGAGRIHSTATPCGPASPRPRRKSREVRQAAQRPHHRPPGQPLGQGLHRGQAGPSRPLQIVHHDQDRRLGRPFRQQAGHPVHQQHRDPSGGGIPCPLGQPRQFRQARRGQQRLRPRPQRQQQCFQPSWQTAPKPSAACRAYHRCRPDPEAQRTRLRRRRGQQRALADAGFARDQQHPAPPGPPGPAQRPQRSRHLGRAPRAVPPACSDANRRLIFPKSRKPRSRGLGRHDVAAVPRVIPWTARHPSARGVPMPELCFLTARELRAALVGPGGIRPARSWRRTWTRSSRLNPAVNAVITLAAEPASTTPTAADERAGSAGATSRPCTGCPWPTRTCTRPRGCSAPTGHRCGRTTSRPRTRWSSSGCGGPG